MRGALPLVLALLALAGPDGVAHAAPRGAPVTIAVAPSGDDRGDGSAAHPVRSVAGAQALLRRARAANAGEVDIVFAAGTYTLDRPLDLGPADSGSPGGPTVFRAGRDAKVELSGGTALTGWSPSGGGEIVAGFDPAVTGGRCPAQLYIGGVRRERPRLPASGVFRTVATTAAGGPIGRPGDLPPSFRPAPDTEIVILDAWVAARLPLSGYDPVSRGLSLGAVFHGHAGATKIAPRTPYYLDNVPAARLAPGQWRCDAAARTIRYRPLPGETLDRLVAVVPRLQRLVRIAGTPAAPAHDIRFEGIGFAATGWVAPATGWAPIQAEVGLPAAVDTTQCARLAFERIRVHATGAGGLRIGAGCRDVEVADGSFTDIGGGALMIGPEDRGTPSMVPRYTAPGPDRTTSNIRIVRNTLAHLGRVQPDAAGIWQGQADHVAIERNRISDLFYSGISIGWVWASSPGVAHDNRVIGNIIADYGHGLLSDMGGIYTLGSQPNTLIAGNQISNGRAAVYGGWGLYADEGSSGITFRDNIVRGTSHAALFAHEDGVLVFANNSASDFGEGGIRCSPPRPDTQVTFEGNHITGQDAPRIKQSCLPPDYRFTK